jgi:hypothetical protein
LLLAKRLDAIDNLVFVLEDTVESVSKHTRLDNGTRAALWHCRLAQLDGSFLLWSSSGVVGVLWRLATFRIVGNGTLHRSPFSGRYNV